MPQKQISFLLLPRAEWGTGEVETYTDSPENILVVNDPFSKQRFPISGRYLQITALYSFPVQDYSGFYGVRCVSNGILDGHKPNASYVHPLS